MSPGATHRHQCMIYDGAPSRMLPSLVTSIRQNLGAHKRCMYFNSPAMVAGLRSGLSAAGTDVEFEQARGALVLSSDGSHLVNGRFEMERMIDTLDASVHAALADRFEGLFAVGDMTWEFGPEKNFSKLVQYEWHLEQLFHRHPGLSGVCQYHRDLLPRDAVRDALVSHSAVFINETLTRLNPHYVMARSPDERAQAARPLNDDAMAMLLAMES